VRAADLAPALIGRAVLVTAEPGPNPGWVVEAAGVLVGYVKHAGPGGTVASVSLILAEAPEFVTVPASAEVGTPAPPGPVSPLLVPAPAPGPAFAGGFAL